MELRLRVAGLTLARIAISRNSVRLPLRRGFPEQVRLHVTDGGRWRLLLPWAPPDSVGVAWRMPLSSQGFRRGEVHAGFTDQCATIPATSQHRRESVLSDSSLSVEMSPVVVSEWVQRELLSEVSGFGNGFGGKARRSALGSSGCGFGIDSRRSRGRLAWTRTRRCASRDLRRCLPRRLGLGSGGNVVVPGRTLLRVFSHRRNGQPVSDWQAAWHSIRRLSAG